MLIGAKGEFLYFGIFYIKTEFLDIKYQYFF